MERRRSEWDRRKGGRVKLPRRVFVAFVLLGLSNALAFGMLVRQSDKTLRSLRAGCEGVNVLRVNQARALRDQVEQTRRSLRGDLGPLEPFRAQVVEGLRLREDALARLRASVRDHPLRGREALRYPAVDRPYRVDCEDAYP